MKVDRTTLDFNYGNDQKNVNNDSNVGMFGDYLKNALDSANEAQIKADDETNKVLTGQTEDLHQALIAAEEARIQMELVVQVRNKLLDSYQEISRMQV